MIDKVKLEVNGVEYTARWIEPVSKYLVDSPTGYCFYIEKELLDEYYTDKSAQHTAQQGKEVHLKS